MPKKGSEIGAGRTPAEEADARAPAIGYVASVANEVRAKAGGFRSAEHARLVGQMVGNLSADQAQAPGIMGATDAGGIPKGFPNAIPEGVKAIPNGFPDASGVTPNVMSGLGAVYASNTLAGKLERARHAGAELNAITDQLNQSLSKALAAIIQLRLGVSANVTLEDDESNGFYSADLAFMKFSNQWGLFVCISNDGGQTERVTPLLEASKGHRFLAAEKLPALMEAMIENVSKQVADARALVAGVDAFTKTLEEGK